MAIDVQSLEPQIREILSAPGIDLTTISAKRVRKQLLDQDTSLTAESVKEKKEEIDQLIGAVYEQISATGGNDESDEEALAQNGKRKRDKKEEGEDEGESEGEVEEEAPPPKKKKSRKSELTDEEIARQLSSELNGRSRSARASSSRGTRGRGGGKRGGKRGAKSAATVDSDGEGQDGSVDGEVKKKTARGTKGGFQKEYALSEPLAAVLNVDKLSRPQVVKQLWVYIKGNSLQNPEYKKEIICDDKLKAIFNVDKIDMFKMNKVLGQHLSEPEPEPAPAS